MKKTIPFSRLTQAQKRVALAKDVIKQLNTKMFIAKQGVYTNSPKIDSLLNNEGEKELSKIIPQFKCECCAKGALFLADIVKRNKYVDDVLTDDEGEISRRLVGIFSKTQLDLIETAFEKQLICDEDSLLAIQNTDNYWDDPTPTDLAKSAIQFGKKHRSAEARLIAIMQNIIKNKGTFIP